MATPSKTIEDVVEFQDELNPKLWDGDKLKPEARKHLLMVADRFVEWLNADLKIKDVQFLGSMTSFNWTNESDIDLHIYADLSKVKDQKVFKELLETKTKLFKEKFPIKLFGIPIELTVEDDSNRSVSNGVYSLTRGEWLKKPKKVKEDSVDTEKAGKLSGMWKKRIKDALQNGEIDSDDLDDLKNDIKDMRRKALKKDGEFSDGNVAFKDLRKSGHIDKIKDVRDKKFEKELTKK